MYKDQMRRDFISALYENVEDLTNEQLNQILMAFDETSLNYEIFSNKALTDISSTSIDTMPPIYHEYLECRRAEGSSQNTVNLMKYVLRYFFLFIKDKKDINDVKANDIRCFLTSYKAARDVSNRTLDLYRIQVCGFFRWASAEGYVDKNPGERIHKIKFIRNERAFLSEDQMEAFRETTTDARETAMIEFMYSTGCRVTEMCDLKISDVDFANCTVTFLGKGGKYRKGYLNAKSIRALRHYLDLRESKDDGCQYLFCSTLTRHPCHSITKETVERIFRKLSAKCFEEVGINITPHILRHTMASHALQSGMPPELIQQVLGHENINTTMIYAKTLDADVKTAHRKYVK